MSLTGLEDEFGIGSGGSSSSEGLWVLLVRSEPLYHSTRTASSSVQLLLNHQGYNHCSGPLPAAPQTGSLTCHYQHRHRQKKLQLAWWPSMLVIYCPRLVSLSVCELLNVGCHGRTYHHLHSQTLDKRKNTWRCCHLLHRWRRALQSKTGLYPVHLCLLQTLIVAAQMAHEGWRISPPPPPTRLLPHPHLLPQSPPPSPRPSPAPCPPHISGNLPFVQSRTRSCRTSLTTCTTTRSTWTLHGRLRICVWLIPSAVASRVCAFLQSVRMCLAPSSRAPSSPMVSQFYTSIPLLMIIAPLILRLRILGTKVPRTNYQLDLIRGAFNIGTIICWLNYNNYFLAAECTCHVMYYLLYPLSSLVSPTPAEMTSTIALLLKGATRQTISVPSSPSRTTWHARASASSSRTSSSAWSKCTRSKVASRCSTRSIVPASTNQGS